MSKHMSEAEKTCILALREESVPIKERTHCTCTGRGEATIRRVAAAARVTPVRKLGSGSKTTRGTDVLLQGEVMKNPSITAADFKKNHPQLLKYVPLRTI